MLELAPKFWRATRALLDPVELARPLGPRTVPPARTLREAVALQSAWITGAEIERGGPEAGLAAVLVLTGAAERIQSN